METRTLMRSVFCSLTAALLLTVSMGTDSFAKDKSKPLPHWQTKPSHAREPMELESQGVFWVGGDIVDRTDPLFAGRKTLVGAAYVEYYIPKNLKKNAAPILLTHSSYSGVVFQTKGDGGEGWVQYFVRQGYPVYVADPPGVGRAGFLVDDANMAATGRIPPAANGFLTRGDSSSWLQWNIGPAFGQLGSGVRGGNGNAMPTDAENLRRFLAAQPPLGPSPTPPPIVGGSPTTRATFIALLEKIGPAIWIGWSGGGNLGGQVFELRPDLFKGLIGIEPGIPSCAPAGGTVDPTVVAKLVTNKVPFLNVNSHVGINAALDTSTRCQEFIAAIKAAGGDATQLQSPDIGVFGNSHMLIWEDGSYKVAEAVAKWIDRHVVKGSRGHDDDDDDDHHHHH